MSRLYLLRHAKACWPTPGMNDIDRPLEQTGIEDAKALALFMQNQGYKPDYILCSAALRTRQTLKIINSGLSVAPQNIEILDHLYSCSAHQYTQTINSYGKHASLLVIGHNPMLEDLAIAFTSSANGSAHRNLQNGFAPCGLAVFDFDVGLSEAELGLGKLHAYVTPNQIQGN